MPQGAHTCYKSLHSAMADASKQPSMTKDEAPDWVPNRAFLDACAGLGLEEPPALLTDTPQQEGRAGPRRRPDGSFTESEGVPEPEPVRASDAFGGVRAYMDATDPVERAVTAAKAAKERANAALTAGDAVSARKRYLAALCCLDEVAGRARQVLIARKVLKPDEDESTESPLHAAARASLLLEAELRLNLAQACLSCGDAAAALAACDAYFALKDAPESNARNAKAHFRAARALEALGRLQEAEGHLKDAFRAAPDDRGIAAALRRVRAARQAKRKGVPKASFKGVLLS